MSLLLGLRRFCVLAEDFSILETNEECLIFCLSRLDEGKDEMPSGFGRVAVVGRAARADFARAVVRFLIGAW
jgi:hypothetical protein